MRQDAGLAQGMAGILAKGPDWPARSVLSRWSQTRILRTINRIDPLSMETPLIMEKAYDLMAGIVSTKANEHMIGFAGFHRPETGEREALEGMVKVSAFHRPDGSGYLTLTFIIDRDPTVLESGQRRLKLPDQETLRQALGSNFEMAMDLPLSSALAASPFFVEEIDIYFHSLRGQEQFIVENTLFPGLQDLHGLHFEPLQAWKPEEESPFSQLLARAEAEVENRQEPPPKSLFQRWFGRD